MKTNVIIINRILELERKKMKKWKKINVILVVCCFCLMFFSKSSR